MQEDLQDAQLAEEVSKQPGPFEPIADFPDDDAFAAHIRSAIAKAKEIGTEVAGKQIKAVWVATKQYRSLVAPVLRDQVFMELCQAADQIRRKGSEDRPILWLIRQPRGLVAATPYDLEALESYRIGSRLTCTIEQPRDEILNRKWHGLVGIVAKAIGKDFRAMKAEILMRTGYIRGVNYFDGTTSSRPCRSPISSSQNTWLSTRARSTS